jgi:hypothetical protein
MTTQQIIDFFENLVDDTLDADFAVDLANNAKDKIEGERPWAMVKRLDSSQSASSAAKTLPTGYLGTIEMRISGASNPLIQVPFEKQDLYTGGGYWYLDMANSQFYLTGSNLSGTIKHFYKKQTDDLTLSTSPIWPAKFHKLIAFEMAELFFAIDQGDRSRSWDDKWSVQRELLRRAMIDWDVALQQAAIESGQYAEGSQQPDVANGIMG